MNANDVAAAFAAGLKAASGNHTATARGAESLYLLHGSVIATWNRDTGVAWIGHAGYPSATTLKALNGLLRAMPWLKFAVKAPRTSGWALTHVITGESRPMTDAGVWLARRVVNGVPSWEFGDTPTTGSLAPTLGKN